MGAPKQKWTSEEESALKTGVVKHGAGKWRTILKDPEYSGILYLRSNVDLKDKWRNMSVLANGWGSRDKARLAVRKMHQVSKYDESSMALSSDFQSDEDIDDAEPDAVSSGTLQIAGPKKPIIRLENLIMEAVTSLKEPGGSNKTTISTYIEEQYLAPPNFRRLLSEKLKFLTANRTLYKVKRKYRTTPPAYSNRRRATSMLLLDGRKRVSPKADRIDALTKAQIDLELAKMRTMTAEEAAAVAAQAVAEAEAAMAAAEEAAREAEAAEADAQATQAFAEAARKTLKERTPQKMQMIRA